MHAETYFLNLDMYAFHKSLVSQRRSKNLRLFENEIFCNPNSNVWIPNLSVKFIAVVIRAENCNNFSSNYFKTFLILS